MNRTSVFAKAFYSIVCLVVVYIFITQIPSDTLHSVAEEHRLLGAVLFAGIMFSTTVIAPLTSLPMVPMVAVFLGPFTTGVACFIGWTLGAVVAFLIGRHLGQPFVAKYIGLEHIKKYEKYIDLETGFMLIVVLRMLLPVDILSYALGLVSTVSLRIYVLATMIGIFWFSFAFAYGGKALVDHDYVLLSSIGVASVVILGFSWWYIRNGTRKNREYN